MVKRRLSFHGFVKAAWHYMPMKVWGQTKVAPAAGIFQDYCIIHDFKWII